MWLSSVTKTTPPPPGNIAANKNPCTHFSMTLNKKHLFCQVVCMMDKSFFMATSNCCWISARCGEYYSWLVLLSTVRYLLIFPHSSLKPIVSFPHNASIVSFPHNEMMCWTSDLKTWTVWVLLILRTSWFHLGSAYHPECAAPIFWVHIFYT